MTIKEVSEKFGLTQDTLRYYEKIGLLDNVERDEQGNRNYQEKDFQRLEFVICMRDAGLSIQVLKDYLTLYEQGDVTIEERKNLLIQEREKLIKKQQLIQKSIDKLDYKIENYEKILKIKI